jgi:Big-like domain-containing protein
MFGRLALALTCALAGCSGTPPPSSLVAFCTAPLIVDAQAKLVSPADGTTGVPASGTTVTFSYSNAALASGTVTFTPPNGQSVSAAIAAAANGRAQASPPQLQPGTTYFVQATSSATFGVCQSPVIGRLGSFTTQ